MMKNKNRMYLVMFIGICTAFSVVPQTCNASYIENNKQATNKIKQECQTCLVQKENAEMIVLHPEEKDLSNQHALCKECLKNLNAARCPIDNVELDKEIFITQGIVVPGLHNEDDKPESKSEDYEDDDEDDEDEDDYDNDNDNDNEEEDDDSDEENITESHITAIKNTLNNNADCTVPNENSQVGKLLQRLSIYSQLENLKEDLINAQVEFSEDDIREHLEQTFKDTSFGYVTAEELENFYQNFIGNNFESTYSDDPSNPQDLSNHSFLNPAQKTEFENLPGLISAKINSTYPANLALFIRQFAELNHDTRQELLTFEKTIRQAQQDAGNSLKREREESKSNEDRTRRFHEKEDLTNKK